MRLIDADALKEEVIAGKIVIDEDVLECDSLHDILVYLLEKVDALVVEKIDAQPTVDVVGEIVERLEEPTNYTIIAGKHFTTVDRAIEIVKEVGGMNDEMEQSK